MPIVRVFAALSLWRRSMEKGMVCGSKMSDPAGPLPDSSSVVGRVAGSTFHAVDEETVHLVVLGMQQDCSAVST
jgi:hypothetical protein